MPVPVTEKVSDKLFRILHARAKEDEAVGVIRLTSDQHARLLTEQRGYSCYAGEIYSFMGIPVERRNG